MARLKTNAKRKLNKALTRVEKVVIMDVRRMLEQQRKFMRTRSRILKQADI